MRVGHLLQADAALPKAQRRFLQDFEQPRIETNVGVAKPGESGVRYADVLVSQVQVHKVQGVEVLFE